MSKFFPSKDLGKKILGKIKVEEPAKVKKKSAKAKKKPGRKKTKPDRPKQWTLKKPRAKPGEGFNWNLVHFWDVRKGTKSENLLQVFKEMQEKDPEEIFHYTAIQREMIKRGHGHYDGSQAHRTVVILLRRIIEVERHPLGNFRLDLSKLSKNDPCNSGKD